jgi:hypothetical protein
MKHVHKSDRRSLWSAAARRRFSSRLRILQTLGTKDPNRLPFNHCPEIEADYQSGVDSAIKSYYGR